MDNIYSLDEFSSLHQSILFVLYLPSIIVPKGLPAEYSPFMDNAKNLFPKIVLRSKPEDLPLNLTKFRLTINLIFSYVFSIYKLKQLRTSQSLP